MAFGRRQPQATAEVNTNPASAANAPGTDVATDWVYLETQDEMTGQKAKHATFTSNNPFLLPFPYNHATRVELVCIKTTKLSAGLALMNGQYAPFSGAMTFSSKVDDGRAVKWIANRTNTQGFVIIETPVHFISEIRSGRELMIEIALYQAGHRVFKFNCFGLDDSFR